MIILPQDSVSTHTACSMIAGLVGAAFATPADVIKSRMMNQPIDERGKGRGMLLIVNS